jgi:carbon-monoxide dehydrogenase medium subunit
MTRRMEVYQPSRVADAVAILDQFGEEGKVLAGGTAVNILLRQSLIAPAALVDIGRIADLDEIAINGREIRIGALTRHRAVESSEVIRAHLSVLCDTFAKVGNVRIRNQATVGGVVAEADYASDPPAVLVGLDASIDVRTPAGERRIPAAAFFRGFYETALEPTELVVAVSVPLAGDGFHGVYEKFVTRSAEDRPCVGVFAACRRLAAGMYGDVRVAVGAVSHKPQRFPDLEALAVGTDLADDVCASLADGYAGRIEPLADVRGSAWYRSEMIRVWVRRALARARDAA